MFRSASSAVLVVVALGVTARPASAQAPDLEPIPTFYQEPGVSRNRDYVNQHFSEHIDPFSGKLQLHYTDLFIPGPGGFDLRIGRSYSSIEEGLGEATPYGMGWTMHFGRVLRKATVAICDFGKGPQVNPVFEAPDGSRQILYVGLPMPTEPAGYYISTGRWKANCLGAGTGLRLFSPDGTSYDMTERGPTVGSPANAQNTWYPSLITDRNGNWIRITYHFFPLFRAPMNITTSDGRSVTFGYQNVAGGNVLTSVTDGPRTWRYVHVGVPSTPSYTFLQQVIRPDGTSWRYDYHFFTNGAAGNRSMRRLTYPTGGTVDYQYNFHNPYTAANFPRSVVVTQKTTSDGGIWSFAYRAALTLYTGVFNPNALDETRVTAPDGVTTFWHLGYRSATSGRVYAIGVLLGRQIGSLQTETFTVAPQTISAQTNQRPGAVFIFDPNTSAPLIQTHVINRGGANHQTTWSDFDAFGNPKSIAEVGAGVLAEPRNSTVSYFVSPTRWIINVKKDETIAGVGTIGRTFDGNANLMIENRFGVVTNFTYHSTGDLMTRRDARGVVTSYLNYFRGIPRTENQPEAVNLTRVVSPAGNVTSETDGEGRPTGYDYDGLNRVTAIRRPVGNAIGVVWTATTRTVTRGVVREVRSYDPFGREFSVTATDTSRGESIVVTHGYDHLSRRVFTSYPNGGSVGTRYQYDMLGRPTRVLHAFNNSNSSFDASRQYAYVGNDVNLTNERGLPFQYRYRAFGNPDSTELMRTHTPVAAADVFIVRNKLGQVTDVTQDGATRTIRYDGRFFVDFTTDPEVGLVDYGRDAVGNMTSRQVAGGPLVTFVPDGRNRVRTVTYPADARSVTREYFRTDKLRSVDNGLARREYVYDPNDNLRFETLTSGGRNWTVEYAYNLNDALQSIRYGLSGLLVDYAPDGFGRPTRAGNWVTNVLHHPSGALRSMTYANGVVTNVSQDGRLRPDILQVRGVSPLFTLDYGYDAISNVQSITDSVDGSQSRTLGYDGIDRLIVANSPVGPGSISYDGRGNITSQSFPGLSLSYVYNRAVNRLTGITGGRGWTFSYDVQGNVTGDGSTTFRFDSASLMRCARCSQPDEILYDYDGAGQRVSQVRSGQATLAMHGFGGNLMWELSPAGVLKEYVYLGNQQVVVRETNR